MASSALAQPVGGAGASSPRITSPSTQILPNSVDAYGAIKPSKETEAAIKAALKASGAALGGTREPVSGLDPDIYRNGGASPLKAGLNPLAIGLRIGPDPRTQMPIVGAAVEGILADRIRVLASACVKGDASACKTEGGLGGVLSDLRSASSANPDCSDAAAAYVKYYPDLEASEEIARAYDQACLGSLEPRAVGTAYVRDQLPAALAALHQPEKNQFTPIAVLEVGDKPFCGGLLRNDRTVVTARHCFEDAAVAWQNGDVKVRPVDGRGGPWPVDKSYVKAGASDAETQGDWAVVKLLTTDDMKATPVESARAAPGPASVLAYFTDHRAAPYGEAASSDDWRRGLRWPRPGFCAVEDSQADCVRLVCQTVKGFSGAPVFVQGADGRVSVVGFISRAAVSEGAACGAPTPYVTIAVAAAAAGS